MINYFQETKSSQWDLSDAIIFYKSKHKCSTNIALQMIKKELQAIPKTRVNTFKKGEEIIKIIKVIEEEPTVMNTSVGTINKINNVEGSVNNNCTNINIPNKKRKSPENDPLIEFNERYSDEDLMNTVKSSLTLNKANKTYTIHTPSTKLPSPNKPKIEIANKETLNEYCLIGNSSIENRSTNSNNPAYIEYQTNFYDQKNNTSLKSIPEVIPFLKEILKQDMQNFIKWIASYEVDSIDSNHNHQQHQFISIMKYSLIDFHCNCQSIYASSNHERTKFIEYIVPSFKALSKVTGLLNHTWCEKQLESNRFIQLCLHNFKNVNKKLADGIGIMKNHHEKIIIEVSSGFDKEDIKHSLDDSIKLIEAAVNTLLTEMTVYKEASINTFKKIEIYSIQVIKNCITMYSTSIYNKKKWKHVELRSAQVPTKWSEIHLWVKYFELLATLMIKLEQQQLVYIQLQNEMTGLVDIESETVREFS